MLAGVEGDEGCALGDGVGAALLVLGQMQRDGVPPQSLIVDARRVRVRDDGAWVAAAAGEEGEGVGAGWDVVDGVGAVWVDACEECILVWEICDHAGA